MPSCWLGLTLILYYPDTVGDVLIGKGAVQETGVAGIRGLKVFFSDKQEKGHFAADSAEV